MNDEQQKQYVSYLGYDFTQYVNTDEDVKLFNKICELEKLTQRPMKECISEVVEVLNLSDKLKGRTQKRHHLIGNVRDN